MANREEWCSKQISNLLEEELRVPTLNAIKDHFSSIPPEEATKTANCLPLASIFDCLNNTNVEQVDLACEVLTLCMSHLNIGNTLKRYSVPIERALQHPYSSVKIMALNEINRNFEIGGRTSYFDGEQFLINCIIQCIADEDLEVAKIASDIVCRISTSNDYVQRIFSGDTLEKLHQSMQTNEIVRLRFNELFIKMSINSEQTMYFLKSNGLLIILNDLDSNDILLKMNVIELLSQLVVTKHGYEFLESHGVIMKILNELESDDVVSLQLCEPGVLKFFGHMAHWKPAEVLVKYTNIINRIFSIIQEENSSVIGIAMDTLGYIGESNEGKFTLDSIDQLVVSTLKVIHDSVQTYSTEIKIRALNCLENLFNVTTFDSKITNLLRKWYYSMDNNPMNLIYGFAKNPFNEIRLAAFGVLLALASHNWGQEVFRNTPGFIEFLLDRRSENYKDCKEAKFNIVKAISSSSVFDHSTQKRLQAFVSEGPFYVQAVTEVAIEGD